MRCGGASRRSGPAVPVAARDSLSSLRDEADEVVCLDAPAHLGAIGEFYGDFHGVEDEEVIALLNKAREALETRASWRIRRQPLMQTIGDRLATLRARPAAAAASTTEPTSL